VPDQCVFEVRLGVLVPKVEELQHERVLDGLFGRQGITGFGQRALFQHRRLVVRQGGSLIELAADLSVELAHAPAAAQGFSLVEGASLRTLDGQQAHIG